MSRDCRISLWILTISLLTIVGLALLGNINNPSSEAPGALTGPMWDADVDGMDETSALSEQLPAYSSDVAPILSRHCANCHGEVMSKGDFSLPLYSNDAAAAADRKTWDRVGAVIHSRRMPPADRQPLTPAESAILNAWLDRVASPARDSGRVTLRRLNRAEYDNTIHDLVGIAFRPAADFPSDDSGDGFDTLGDVLSVSPILIEKYLNAAETVIDAASANVELWARISHPPTADFIPFVLRGSPPQRDMAVKGLRPEPTDPVAESRAAEIDRTYAALQAFADRAYRRPITHAETARLMRFVDEAVNSGSGADSGLKLALKAVLVSPHFLFKIESDPAATTGTERRLNDFELATRLSYFLWSSLPDEHLLRVAAAGTLHEPRVLVTQIRRMLQDAKSRALAENFAGQWLQTRSLAEATRDAARFPSFDAELVAAMRTESELFFDHIVREDSSVIELLSADYTFANERLARHYGITGVTGMDFRRVSLAGTGRVGVLTQGGVLTVTSGPARTSPVKRGKWILENLLGANVPTPPPGVDTLKETGAGRSATLREQLEKHRSRAECASCHSRIDPLGFGLQNFDAVGAWRDHDADAAVDSSGTLPDGRAFRGPAELVAAVAERPDEFARCLTRKLLTYGLGRSLGLSDHDAIERIVRHTANNGYRFSSLVIALVRSDVFQNRRVQPGGLP
jgi:Protein of unknown function (DUF1592)/Protein of unknown function (DUF1588)/Protein of unknown function (DUF1587)/Protein of unknown function (DUF1585)/Protein of unknown function (DUF1595)